MTRKHIEAAQLVAIRMRSGPIPNPTQVSRDYNIGGTQAYAVIERAQELHIRWQLAFFAPPPLKVARRVAA